MRRATTRALPTRSHPTSMRASRTMAAMPSAEALARVLRARRRFAAPLDHVKELRDVDELDHRITEMARHTRASAAPADARDSHAAPADANGEGAARNLAVQFASAAPAEEDRPLQQLEA